jgi:hypothetical protein
MIFIIGESLDSEQDYVNTKYLKIAL